MMVLALAKLKIIFPLFYISFQTFPQVINTGLSTTMIIRI